MITSEKYGNFFYNVWFPAVEEEEHNTEWIEGLAILLAVVSIENTVVLCRWLLMRILNNTVDVMWFLENTVDTMCNFYLLVGSISVPGGSEKCIIAATCMWIIERAIICHWM